jgi:hypothetical protein
VCRIILTYETAAARSVVPQKRGFPAHFVIRQGQEPTHVVVVAGQVAAKRIRPTRMFFIERCRNGCVRLPHPEFARLLSGPSCAPSSRTLSSSNPTKPGCRKYTPTSRQMAASCRYPEKRKNRRRGNKSACKIRAQPLRRIAAAPARSHSGH